MSLPLRIFIGVLVAVILMALAGGAFVWWKLAGLKQELVRQLEAKAGAQVEIASLNYNLMAGELRATGVTLANTRPDAPWEKGSVAQIAVHFRLLDVLSPTLPISITATGWTLSLTPHSEASLTPSATTSTTPAQASPSASQATENAMPHLLGGFHVRVTSISAQEGSVDVRLHDGNSISLTSVAFDASSTASGDWTTAARCSTVTAGSFKAKDVSVQLRSESNKILFSELRMTCRDGMIEGSGERELTGNHATRVSLKASTIPVHMLVSAPWQTKISGRVDGTVEYRGDDRDATATGKVAMTGTRLNFLSWVFKMTSYVGLPDVSNVDLDKVTSDFEWHNGAMHLANVDIRKNDIIRIAGDADIDPTGTIDARAKLGLPSGVVGKVPSLQEKIFTVQSEDYSWTDVHVTGTPDHLQEDLSSRVLAAGLQEGGGLLDKAKEKASDLLKKFLGN